MVKSLCPHLHMDVTEGVLTRKINLYLLGQFVKTSKLTLGKGVVSY